MSARLEIQFLRIAINTDNHMDTKIFSNRVCEFEQQIAAILARLAHHVHPAIVEQIQKRNIDEFDYFSDLFQDRIPVDSYLYDGSACVFPGVKRYVSGKGKKKSYNPEYAAIIDDNTFPRHLWCYIAGGKSYSGPAWKNLGLSEFELAHIFSHKESELATEKSFFASFDRSLLPYGDFSCACNTILLPKGTVRPTDNSHAIKSIFYRRYIDLYGESPLRGRSGFLHKKVPEWYDTLQWNEPVLPENWKGNIDQLLLYRTKRITYLLSNQNSE